MRAGSSEPPRRGGVSGRIADPTMAAQVAAVAGRKALSRPAGRRAREKIVARIDPP